MKAFELVGEVDEARRLHAVLPESATPGRVRVIVLLPEADEADDEASTVNDWLAVSTPSLREVWDNDEDAIYDDLPAR